MVSPQAHGSESGRLWRGSSSAAGPGS